MNIRRILISVCVLLLSVAGAMGQIVNPVRWSGEAVGDSVRLTAEIEAGWHLTVIEANGTTVGEE